MTRSPFVIHGCTVAGKPEHGVEPGVMRTWVNHTSSPKQSTHGSSSSRVWWADAGVHRNITFPDRPDPIGGMSCRHQKVRVRPAEPSDRYADIHADFAQARAVCRTRLSLARPAAGDLRRPIWLFRPVEPVLDAYALPEDGRTRQAREAAAGDRPDARDLADHVDWSPAEVWGPLAGAARTPA